MQSNLELIREKVIEAHGDTASGNLIKWGDRPIRLTDVLYATENKWRTMYSAAVITAPGGDIPLREGQMLYYIVSKWNLLQDDLSLQTPETWALIVKILNV